MMVWSTNLKEKVRFQDYCRIFLGAMARRAEGKKPGQKCARAMSGKREKQLRREEQDRRDHILPQGYLDLFTDPSDPGRLYGFHCQKRKWFPTGTRAVAAKCGFYDYAPGGTPDETADAAFKELEDNYPARVQQLVATGFTGWKRELTLLLHFAQMLRARSELFREETVVHGRSALKARVEKVVYRLGAENFDKLQTGIKYQPFDENSSERDILLRNQSITDMRAEVKKGPDWLLRFDWHLLLTDDPEDPFITGDNALNLIGQEQDRHEAAMKAANSTMIFPVCWQACLIGTVSGQNGANAQFDSPKKIRRLYLNADSRFAYSPRVLAADA
jgi:hypothetical protein